MKEIVAFPKIKESISEIDSHHILQKASELWSCN